MDMDNICDIIEDCLALANDIRKNEKLLIGQLRTLRNICARGSHYQVQIVEHEQLSRFLEGVLFDATPSELQTLCWQLLANSIVNNVGTQQLIWEKFGDRITRNCAATPLGTGTNIQLMIVQNIFTGSNDRLTKLHAIQIAVGTWRIILEERCKIEFEYLHFLFEHFLVHDGRSTVCSYSSLCAEDRLTFLDYLANYLSQDSPNGLVHDFLLRHISKEFRVKSDCILRQTNNSEQNVIHPREAYALLKVLATASGCEKYTSIYATDHSLFLNISSLLRCLVATGKKSSPNTFTPLNRLEDVAPSSEIPTDFEKEISYELKTLLVRSTANLLYKNRTNQGYCHDTELMPILFECTNMDARNPLIKEWSIVAIRNACIGCVENQNTIMNLSNQGSVKNDVLTELNLDLGSLRIQPNTG